MASFSDTCTHTALFSATDDTANGQEWATPKDFFDKLDNEFHFVLDAAASHDNHKCSVYFTKEQDGLMQSWDCGGGGSVVQSSIRKRDQQMVGKGDRRSS